MGWLVLIHTGLSHCCGLPGSQALLGSSRCLCGHRPGPLGSQTPSASPGLSRWNPPHLPSLSSSTSHVQTQTEGLLRLGQGTSL